MDSPGVLIELIIVTLTAHKFFINLTKDNSKNMLLLSTF